SRVRGALRLRRHAGRERARARVVPRGRRVALRRRARLPGHGAHVPAPVGRDAAARAAAAGARHAVSAGTEWSTKSERGNNGWLRFALFLYTNFGRWAVAAILVPICTYFLVLDKVTRRSSREWLATAWATPEGRAALGRKPGWRATFRHVYGFS